MAQARMDRSATGSGRVHLPCEDLLKRDDGQARHLWECDTRSSQGGLNCERPVWVRADSTSVGTPQTWLSERWWDLASPEAGAPKENVPLEALAILARTGAAPGWVQPSCRQGGPQSWRRRMYRSPCEAAAPPRVRTAAEAAGSGQVILCGPLQRRVLGFCWCWRWCVLEPAALHVYRSEARRREAPGQPLESIEVGRIFASPEGGAGFQHTFRCADRTTLRSLAAFRAGVGDIWEEIAAARLWVDLLNTAARIACNPQAEPSTTKISGILWHEAILGA
ncbi:unnamed protein product [Prorocentrum cordatum]|uniref:Uncharacterized protein n=1 Tax=Prorocentrum cordatum TaxID=2364126 RepID=A0ABN9UHW0_9DINO|nr:unnamed protein product [Polarella glacialis]